MRYVLGLIAVGWAAVSAAPAGAELERFEYQQIEMGVPFKILLYAADEPSANSAARAAFRRIDQLNSILSDYDPDSELSRLCRSSGPGKPVKVGGELLYLLSKSQALSRETGGAFDVTVGPVVKLWRKARRRKQLPDSQTLSQALDRLGHEMVHIDCAPQTVELQRDDMLLDLGGIAKGYAADEALCVLKEHGISRALIDASGDIVVGDPPPGKEGWVIGVAPLDSDDGKPSRHLSLANRAVATSGDAFQYIELAGRRYSHLVDPKTGLGLTGRSSVTVVASDGTTADSLASAVSVLGPEKGMQLIKSRDDAAALVVSMQDGEVKTTASERFEALER